MHDELELIHIVENRCRQVDAQLQTTRERQGIWSNTANALKSRYENARKICFCLSIGAAVLAALASQLPSGPPPVGKLRLGLTIASAVCLALLGIVSTRFLGGQNATTWIRARAASEALKRLAYTYAAQADPYPADTTGGSAQNLARDRQKVEEDVDDLSYAEVTGIDGSTPTDVISHAEYIQSRGAKQKEYYEKNATRNQAAAKNLRRIELGVAVLATVITAAVGVNGKSLIHNLPFDFVALTAVLTTLSGAILAYIEASKLDFIIMSYRATARRLSEALTNTPDPAALDAAKWSIFVKDVEDILATENNAWVLKVGKVQP